jgi:hypothetical protein
VCRLAIHLIITTMNIPMSFITLNAIIGTLIFYYANHAFGAVHHYTLINQPRELPNVLVVMELIMI